MSDDEGRPLLDVPYEQDVEPTGCGATLPCDPRRNLHRYLVLIFMCLLSFGSYYCYDNPSAISDIMQKNLDLNTESYMGFYSWYSWPNVVLCFFGGFLVDKVFGVRAGAIIFAGFVTVGQLIFAAGAYWNLYWLMCAGRVVFGIGGESLAVTQNTYAVSWFKGKELNMVFGLQLSLARIGSTVNMNSLRPIYESVSKSGAHFTGYQEVGVTLFIALATCVFSLICAIILGYFDWRAGKILKKNKVKSGEVIKISDLKTLLASGPLWMVCIICVAYYVTVFPFIGVGLVFFEQKFDMPPATAAICNSLVYILSAVGSPLFGFLIDRLGKNIFWILLGTLITLGCHALMGFTFITPFVAMVTMGMAYSILASALWPLVAYFIPEHQLGTAYGLMQSVQNLGLASIALASGAIVDNNGYLILEVFNMMWLCLALIFGVLLYLWDLSKGGHLNMSAKDRKRQQKAKEEEAKSS